MVFCPGPSGGFFGELAIFFADLSGDSDLLFGGTGTAGKKFRLCPWYRASFRLTPESSGGSQNYTRATNQGK
jgi:hypothetical protein